MTKETLFEMAMEAKEFSYAPFSKFHVGAALVAESGKVYKGCNVENSSFGATICAERTAFVKAISEGEREFRMIMIVSDQGGAWPCGICRQFMEEFCQDDFVIMTGDDPDNIKEYTLKELLPEGFKL